MQHRTGDDVPDTDQSSSMFRAENNLLRIKFDLLLDTVSA